jgi:hypothetical protein
MTSIRATSRTATCHSQPGIRGKGSMSARCVTDWPWPQGAGSSLAAPVTSHEEVIQVRPDGDLQNIRGDP